jgi:hypothetical protein
MRIAAPLTALMLACVLALVCLFTAGCQTPQTPPLVQLYAAKQAYTASLDATTTLIRSGQIHDANTLMRIRDARTIVEAGLAEAERAARAGDAATFRTWMDRVNAALELYLQLQGPTTRPVSLAPETPWTPQRSSLSSSPAARPLPRWLAPSTPSTPAARSAPSSRPRLTASWPQREPATTPH